MKRLFLLLFVLLLLRSPCRAQQDEVKTPPLFSSEDFASKDDAVVQRRLKPLERPRVGFRIEQAAHVGDSLWIVVRISIPHGAIRARECLHTTFLLHTDPRNADPGYLELNTIQLFDERIKHTSAVKQADGETVSKKFTPRSNRTMYLYYSSKFPYIEGLEGYLSVEVITRLTKKGYRYNYQNLALPFIWRTSPDAWKGADKVQDEDLLDHSPLPDR